MNIREGRVRVCEYTHVRERMCAFHNGLSFRTGRERLEVSFRPLIPTNKTLQGRGRGLYKATPISCSSVARLEYSHNTVQQIVLLNIHVH